MNEYEYLNNEYIENIGGAYLDDNPVKWHWRNCRALGLTAQFRIWPWVLRWGKSEDFTGGHRYVIIWFIAFQLDYGIGDKSSEYRIISKTALSENEAWVRSVNWEYEKIKKSRNKTDNVISKIIRKKI